jgi:hypothetical protein
LLLPILRLRCTPRVLVRAHLISFSFYSPASHHRSPPTSFLLSVNTRHTIDLSAIASHRSAPSLACPMRRCSSSLAGAPPPRRHTAPLVSTSLSPIAPLRGADDGEEYSVEGGSQRRCEHGEACCAAITSAPAALVRAVSGVRPWCEAESGILRGRQGRDAGIHGSGGGKRSMLPAQRRFRRCGVVLVQHSSDAAKEELCGFDGGGVGRFYQRWSRCYEPRREVLPAAAVVATRQRQRRYQLKRRCYEPWAGGATYRRRYCYKP